MRIFVIGTLASAAVVSSAAAQSARQFDLKCEGTRQLGIDEPVEPASYGFRIDLDAKRWCWDHCERVYEIQTENPDRIVFEEEEIDTPRRRSSSSNVVSRIDGTHRSATIITRGIPMFIETKGKCTAAPFSGFPTAMF